MNQINYITRAKSLIEAYQANKDENSRNDTLKQLKIMMLHFASLPPSNLPINLEEYYLARSILEAEMEAYINRQDGKSFELAYQKIKQFYFDYK